MTTYLEPTQESGRALVTRAIKGEVVMLNLLRFREVADYSAIPGCSRSPSSLRLFDPSFADTLPDAGVYAPLWRPLSATEHLGARNGTRPGIASQKRLKRNLLL